MITTHRLRRALATAAVTLALAATAAVAPADAANSGGFAAPQKPTVVQLSCAPDTKICRQGQLLTVTGTALDTVTEVVFLGRAGTRDDVTAPATAAGEQALTATVPAKAHSGRVRVIADTLTATGPKLKVRAARPGSTPATAPSGGDASAASTRDGIFPIQGKHDLGQSATNNFGGPRDHKGQDMFAACGTPLVSALPGTVTIAKYQERAGNYAVITDPSGQSEVYMHMRAPALVSTGQSVRAGEAIGQVGDSGDAEGCHLHFELWTAPGWYNGGQQIDPLPTLKRWDAATSHN